MTPTKPIPTPRSGPYGQPAPRIGDTGTWLENDCDGRRRARVRFPDGKLRVVSCRGTADTYFSVHCYSNDGYVTSIRTKWSPDGELCFRPHTKAGDKYGNWDATNLDPIEL
jgi:hypothetical protein